MSNFVVAALYKFTALEDVESQRQQVRQICEENEIKGTLIFADEGINGTVAGSRDAIDVLKAFLNADRRYDDMEYKESSADEMPFKRLKVHYKKEIVTIGDQSVSPTKVVGEYVDPQDWNAIISDPDTIVIDTRNDYEVELGTFSGAVNPETDAFREFPEYVKKDLDPKKNKNVAMFCTGGIRCEKASSYMMAQGFEKVYHLKGGILKYLETIPEDESMWEGDCFVFDERVAVSHGLSQSEYKTCYGCRHPISPEDCRSPKFERGVSCPRCFDKTSEEKKAAARHRQQQVDLASKRGKKHIGDDTRPRKP
ncbi:MAG: rhodanese-related sulfurtransferase [Alphaproteobacteria bacterium]